MRWGIYPGSFDPVHRGHLLIAGEALRQGVVDRVLMVPTGSYWQKTCHAGLEHRIRMLKIFENEQIRVETQYNKTASTYESFRLFSQRYQGDELHLILGADNLLRFEEWIQYRKLLAFPFVIAARGDMDNAAIGRKMQSFGKENYAVLNLPDIPISSTQIRNAGLDRETACAWLDERVYAYILREQLYR